MHTQIQCLTLAVRGLGFWRAALSAQCLGAAAPALPLTGLQGRCSQPRRGGRVPWQGERLEGGGVRGAELKGDLAAQPTFSGPVFLERG